MGLHSSFKKKVGFSCSKDDGGISLSRKLGTPPPLTTRQITPNDEKNRSLPPFHHIIHHSRAPIPSCLPPSASPQYYAAPKCPLIPGSPLPPKKNPFISNKTRQRPGITFISLYSFMHLNMETFWLSIYHGLHWQRYFRGFKIINFPQILLKIMSWLIILIVYFFVIINRRSTKTTLIGKAIHQCHWNVLKN